MSDLQGDRCVLCLDDKRYPVRIQCGHSFCNECLEVYKSYRKYSWAHKCPICRTKLKPKKRTVKEKSSGDSHPVDTSSSVDTSSNSMLEQFIAIATDSDSIGSSQLNRSVLSAVDTHVTPMLLSTPDDSDSGDEVTGYADDDDDDRYFSNSDDDDDSNYYYYFEEDQMTWNQQHSSMVEAGNYEHEVVLNPDDPIIVDDDGSWIRLASGNGNGQGQRDSEVVILDDVIIVD